MKKNLKLFAIFIIFFLIIFLSISTFLKIRNKNLSISVKEAVETEFNKINIPNEVSQVKYSPRSGCHYSYKVKAIRCRNIYTKYFVSENNPIEEFLLMDEYLANLSWNYSFGGKKDRENLNHSINVGNYLFQIYKKNSPYALDLHLRFYRDEDLECKYTCSEKVRELLDQYSDEYSSIYSISITSDFVGR